MRIRMTEDAGWCDGMPLRTGEVVDLPLTAALDYIALGKAEEVEDAPPAKPKRAVEEADQGPEPETAMVAPPENAARRPGRPRRA